ncbi:lysophospholipid acyltransferase family protein [Nucisporomicrobium flavum]|uniref:lysophospholipid acyltransferase family protein n=1 Tax=Nucisporomicrobium flavum TaxID=2785915 RepID=UPI0018F29585|nr:lysophospholipid acyltransferase family protein [Nucisporomicrobium flavum]
MQECRAADASPRAGPRIPPVYRVVIAAVWPVVRWWGRLEVVGAEHVPAYGATLVLANHDSRWDPMVIAAAVRRRRQIHALAKASLWKNPLIAWVLDAMGQIPVERGRADSAAIKAAARYLAAGGCVGIFPEGAVSQGRQLRARSGAGRLARSAPQARIVCAAVTGTADIAQFPRRPRLRVTFFEPTPPAAAESARELSSRLTTEIRRLAPVAGSPRR